MNYCMIGVWVCVGGGGGVMKNYILTQDNTEISGSPCEIEFLTQEQFRNSS